jgi:hypothetical protein
LSEAEYENKLKTWSPNWRQYFTISKEINEDITYNEVAKIARNRCVCSTPRKKKEITDLNTKLYVDRYNTVKAENDKFKKTWDGIVNTDFINDLKVNTTSRERRT